MGEIEYKFEIKNTYVCKKMVGRFEIVGTGICGSIQSYKRLSQYWKDVTCKECLKYKEMSLHERNRLLKRNI